MSSLITPTGMISFPVFFVAKAAVAGSEPRFSCNLLFKPEAQLTRRYKELLAIVDALIDEKWGPGKSQDKAWLSRNKIRLPFRPTSDRDYDGYNIPGGVFIAPWSKNKPGLVDADGQPITVPGDIWAGQMARLSVHGFPYDQGGNKGIGFNLNNVQITNSDMPRLDGRKDAQSEFAAAPMDDDEEDTAPRQPAKAAPKATGRSNTNPPF